MKAILVLASMLVAAASAWATVAQYEVRGVRSNDVLNMRAAPTHTAKIVGRIPHNGREIEIIARGKGQWVKISYGRATGFVNRRFLALSKPQAARAAPVQPAAQQAVEAPTSSAPTIDTPVAEEPKAAAAPEAAPALASNPAPTPMPAPSTPPASTPEKLAEPAAANTSLPGEKRDEMDDTPALMKPPAEYMPETVPAKN